MSIIPENYLDIMQSNALAHVATIGPKGEPRVSPVWFYWNGNSILLSMNKVRQKHRNIQREPRVALSIVDPANPYRSLEIRGVVARIDKDHNHRFANSLSQKYLQRDTTPEENPPGEERVVVVIDPELVTVFPFQAEKK